MFVEVAAAMGIHSIRHTDVETTRARLASLGFVSNEEKEGGAA
jgi:hypothetical protein